MTVRAIFAADDEWGIGKDGTLPWPKNKEDLKWFRECTTGHIVVMGRSTWDDPQMPKPLPNRYNVVVSDRGVPHTDTQPDTTIPRNGVKSYLDNIDKDAWIIGGAKLLQSTLQYVDEVWISRIHGWYFCDTEINIGTEFKLFETNIYHDRNLLIQKYRKSE